MYAPAKPDYPIITPDIITTYDAFILGIPTRYGNMPAQWKVNLIISTASSRVLTWNLSSPPRHSGILLVNYGREANSQANMLDYLFPLRVSEEDKSRRRLLPCRPSPTTEFFTSHSVTLMPLPKSPTLKKYTVVSQSFRIPAPHFSALFLKRPSCDGILILIANVAIAGSPWGAGTFAATNGSRQPSALELEIAQIQGKTFYNTVSKVSF